MQKQLPTVRLSESKGDFFVSGTRSLSPESPKDGQSSPNKFAFVWPSDNEIPYAAKRQPMSPEVMSSPHSPGLNESNAALESDPNTKREDIPVSTSFPKLFRAFSMPLPSQLGHLRHPSRTPSFSGPDSSAKISQQSNHSEMSTELADSVQMVIQTLLQLSPPQLLDPAKEQFSACSLQIPTPSISALLTSMKNLNYMSANMPTFSPPDSPSTAPREEISAAKDNFDVGEMLQSVGDALGGLAAQAGVDLVLFHGDVGMKHVYIQSDECGILYALSHVIRQVLLTATHGDTIEIGLYITSPSQGESPSSGAPAYIPPDGFLVCTFEIAHKLATLPASPAGTPLGCDSRIPLRNTPQFNSAILSRILLRIRGNLRSNIAQTNFATGGTCELSVLVERGAPPMENEPLPSEDDSSQHTLELAREPTIDELIIFTESLRGKKVAFYASSQGSFAHHLTSYLTTWGMDVSHIPTDGAEDLNVPLEKATCQSFPQTDSVFDDNAPLTSSSTVPGLVPTVSVDPNDSPDSKRPNTDLAEPSFIIIDDDVVALRRHLLQLLLGAHFLPGHPSKRPSLTAHQRTRSTPHIQLSGKSHAVIVHFTSLSNYKSVKDAIQTTFQGLAINPALPEVIVIPKPAGPRRLLTALHTAVNKPIIDPFFSPIATSPWSSQGGSSFFGSFQHLSSHSTSIYSTPISSTPNADSPSESSQSSKTTYTGERPNIPPSPLSTVDTMEYFSEAAAKIGGSASSGLVIQSPDGKPTGIFFQPSARLAPKSPTPNRPVDRSPRHTDKKKTTPSRLSVSSIAPKDTRTALQGLLATSPGTSSTPSLRPLHGDSLSKGKTRSVSTSQLESTSAHGLVATRSVSHSVSQKPPPVVPTSASMVTHAISVSTSNDTSMGSIEGSFGSAPTADLEPSERLDPTPSQSTTSTPRKRIADLPPLNPTIPASPVPVGFKSAQRKASSRRLASDGKSPTSTPTRKGSEIVPPISVLIVEDNPINQTILSTFMRKKKIKYGVAKDGQEAVEKWRTGGFHLILMDIQMPVMDGIQATKEIRRLERSNNIGIFPTTPASEGARTPPPESKKLSVAPPPSPYRSSVIIVALTASSLNADRVAALAAGCNDFLTKPVSLKWLDKKIIEWGSIKALQMWADPETARGFAKDQAEKAKVVANQLHIVRAGRSASTSSRQLSPIPPLTLQSQPSRSRTPSTERSTISTVELTVPSPTLVSGQDALLAYLADVEDVEKRKQEGQPTLLGRRGLSSQDISITSVLRNSSTVHKTAEPIDSV